LASWILAKCVVCIEIGHLFSIQERKMMWEFLTVCHLMAGVIMGMDGWAISGSCLGSRQLKVLAVIVDGLHPVKATLIDSSTLNFHPGAGKVILEAYLAFPA
jgi:hypothetical protein